MAINGKIGKQDLFAFQDFCENMIIPRSKKRIHTSRFLEIRVNFFSILHHGNRCYQRGMHQVIKSPHQLVLPAMRCIKLNAFICSMVSSIRDFKTPFFIGIAGSGMSAIAQYLKGIGKNVSGSDRFFKAGEPNEIKEKLEAEQIKCFLQNGEGISADTDLVVVSTAVEDTVPEVQKAKQLDIPIIKRSELLALIAESKRTIAVGGTSGKSTTSAMLFDVLEYAGLQPSIISGAGLVSIIKQGKIGNAKVGQGEWLVIEADESDGSIVYYKPEIGLLLNIDKDHKDIETLLDIFKTFKEYSQRFVVNQSHPLNCSFSQNIQ